MIYKPFLKLFRVRPISNSADVDSGVYSALENTNISLCFNREKRLDPLILIDKMMQSLNNLDLSISIALGNILSEKIRHEKSHSALGSSEENQEKKDVGLNAETIFKKLNEVERKLSDALR